MIRNFYNTNKRLSFLLFLSILCMGSSMFAQRIVLVGGTLAGTTGGSLGTTQRYNIEEGLFLDSELNAGPQNSTLTGMRVRVNAAFATTPAGNNIFNNVRVRLKEVPSTRTTLANAPWDTTGYTTVFRGTLNAAGGNVIDVAIPFIAPFPRTAGNNLMVMLERFDNFSHTVGNWQVIAYNTAIPMARRWNINTAGVPPVHGVTASTVLSGYRALYTFIYSYTDPNLSIEHVYTLGKLPIPYGTPHTVQANVANNSVGTLYNVKAKLSITGANSIQDSITIDSILPGKRIVSFPAYNPTNYGKSTVKVDVVPQGAAQLPSSITTFSMDQTVTNNVYSLAYGFNGNPPVAAGGVGFTGGTGDFIAKFYSDSPSKVNQVQVTFNGNPGQTFKIGVWGDSGSGTPGALLWESPNQTSVTGVFTVPVSPKVPVIGNFFVGVRQLGTTNIAFSYQAEAPPRAGSYFYASPTGSTFWIDFATSNSPFRFMVEPKLELANDVGVSQITNPGTGLQIDRCGLVAPTATVTNYGIFDQIDVPVTMEIKENGVPVYTETMTIPSLTSGQILTLTFPQTFSTGMAGAGITNYTANCYTSLVGDQDTLNNGNSTTFSYGDYSYGQDALATYQFANSTICAAAAPFQPTYNWITQTANQVTWPSPTIADDAFAGPIALPFPYNYYGVNYTEFWVSSNGFITFSDPTAWAGFNDGTNAIIPTAGGIENFIAGAWDDLDFSPSRYPDAQVYYGSNPSNPNEFVITFWHAHKYAPTPPVNQEYLTFQIILKYDGRFPFTLNYNDVASLNSSSITSNCAAGFENTTGNVGVMYRRLGSRGEIFDIPTGPLAWSARYPVDKSVSVAGRVYLDHVDATTGLMTVYMNSLSNFPLSDPYAVAPWLSRFPHVNSGSLATTTPAVLSSTGPNAIVDWVMIELREGIAGATTITASKPALLQSDGDIVDVDGVSPLNFVGLNPGNYYIAVRHHNHLGFRTNDPIALGNSTTTLNFTDNSTLLNGSFPTYPKGLVNAMNGGDSNYDGSIDATDTPTWEVQNGLFDDYTNNADYNCDGSVDSIDSIIWESQNGKYEELD
ncbi:MAG: hypothetical protein ACOYOA_07780 [Saprospiraceae bacterium]